MKQALAIIAMLFIHTLAVGQSPPLESAKELQKACIDAMNVFENEGAASSQEAAQYGKCLGYVEGVLDSMRNLTQTSMDGSSVRFHLRGNGFVMKDAVVFFLDFVNKDKVSDRDGPAAAVVIQALAENNLVTTSETSVQIRTPATIEYCADSMTKDLCTRARYNCKQGKDWHDTPAYRESLLWCRQHSK